MSGNSLYSIFSVLAYTAGGLVFYARSRRSGFDAEKLLYIVFSALLGALVGSKLGSALFVYREYFLSNPLIICSPFAGGKTVVGGLLGGYTGVIVAKKLLRIERSTGDMFAPGLALGIAIGRIGCFFNGCCRGIGGHPAQLYESAACLILFLFLRRFESSLKREGDVFKLFLLGYSLLRFLLEFIRADAVKTGLGISAAQVICIIIFTAVGAHFIRRRGICAKKAT